MSGSNKEKQVLKQVVLDVTVADLQRPTVGLLSGLFAELRRSWVADEPNRMHEVRCGTVKLSDVAEGGCHYTEITIGLRCRLDLDAVDASVEHWSKTQQDLLPEGGPKD